MDVIRVAVVAGVESVGRCGSGTNGPGPGRDRVVPWRSAGDLVGSYEVPPGSRGRCALRSMTVDLAPGATFDYRGTSRYDAGRLEDGSAYVLMELLEGRSLYQLMQDEGRLAPRRLAEIMSQVAEGMFPKL